MDMLGGRQKNGYVLPELKDFLPIYTHFTPLNYLYDISILCLFKCHNQLTSRSLINIKKLLKLTENCMEHEISNMAILSF